MAGEYDDYRRAFDEVRRDSWSQAPRSRAPAWRKALRILYWLGAPICTILYLVIMLLNN